VTRSACATPDISEVSAPELTSTPAREWGLFLATSGDFNLATDIEGALRIAERSGDDLALAFARMTLGVALVHRPTDVERDRGQKLLAEVSEVFLRRGHNLGELRIINVYSAREKARRGHHDGPPSAPITTWVATLTLVTADSAAHFRPRRPLRGILAD
jgi:hypothetical protein